MTPDLVHALTISGGILVGVVVLIVIVSIVTVNRGADQLSESSRNGRSRH